MHIKYKTIFKPLLVVLLIIKTISVFEITLLPQGILIQQICNTAFSLVSLSMRVKLSFIPKLSKQ